MILVRPDNRSVAAIFIPALLFLFIASCGRDKDIFAGQEDVYDGLYTQGIEDSWFDPCADGEKSWKPVFTKSAFSKIYDVFNNSDFSGKLYVIAKGIPSEKGDYKGWFARYDREFEIREIVEVRPSESGECP